METVKIGEVLLRMGPLLAKVWSFGAMFYKQRVSFFHLFLTAFSLKLLSLFPFSHPLGLSIEYRKWVNMNGPPDSEAWFWFEENPLLLETGIQVLRTWFDVPVKINSAQFDADFTVNA